MLASHVLYPIADVAPFLRKLDASARRICYIAIRVDQMLPQIAPLWHAIWNSDRPREPGFLDLYNLLWAIGLWAQARLVPFGSGVGFESRAEALDHLRRLLFVLEHDDAPNAHIQAFLDDALVSDGDHLVLPYRAQAAIVWWEKDSGREDHPDATWNKSCNNL